MWIRSRTRTSRAVAYTLEPAVPISTVHACGAGWRFRAACSRAASPPSDGAGAAAGARLTTSTSRRRAAEQGSRQVKARAILPAPRLRTNGLRRPFALRIAGLRDPGTLEGRSDIYNLESRYLRDMRVPKRIGPYAWLEGAGTETGPLKAAVRRWVRSTRRRSD